MKNIIISLAKLSDLDSWMELVNLIRKNFPGLDKQDELENYKETVIKNINRQTAICVKDNGKIVGILLFSKKQNMLCCMGVHPNYRRIGIANKLIEEMLIYLPKDSDVTVTTFREEDEKGTAPRALYKSFGFVESELCYEFGYPHQKFILYKRNEEMQ